MRECEGSGSGGCQGVCTGSIVITDRLQEFPWIQPGHVLVFKTKRKNKIGPSGVLTLPLMRRIYQVL